MALHIADTEVDRLTTELAKQDNVSKTEALRRLLRREFADRTLRRHRQDFSRLAREVMEEGRAQQPVQVTKKEFDDLWGM